MIRSCFAGCLLFAATAAGAQSAPLQPINPTQPGQPAQSADPLSEAAATTAAPPTFSPDTASSPQPSRGPVRISGGVMAGALETKVDPVYPPEARSGSVEGAVVLSALINKMGKVQSLSVVTGVPVLASAAVDAVRQWTYKPYLLNGQPVEVRTTITINFHRSPPSMVR